MNDLLIIQTPGLLGERERVGLTFGATTRSVHGIQKLSQWVAQGLLTRLGSSRHDPEWGTILIDQMTSRGNVDDTAAQEIFSQANQQLLAYQAENLLDDRPDDEILESANLLSFNRDGARVSLRVRVVSAAGDQREFEVPVDHIA